MRLKKLVPRFDGVYFVNVYKKDPSLEWNKLDSIIWYRFHANHDVDVFERDFSSLPEEKNVSIYNVGYDPDSSRNSKYLIGNGQWKVSKQTISFWYKYSFTGEVIERSGLLLNEAKEMELPMRDRFGKKRIFSFIEFDAMRRPKKQRKEELII